MVVNLVFEGGQAVRGHKRHEGLMRLVVVDVSVFLSIHPSQSVYGWLPGDRRAVLTETGVNYLEIKPTGKIQ